MEEVMNKDKNLKNMKTSQDQKLSKKFKDIVDQVLNTSLCAQKFQFLSHCVVFFQKQVKLIPEDYLSHCVTDLCCTNKIPRKDTPTQKGKFAKKFEFEDPNGPKLLAAAILHKNTTDGPNPEQATSGSNGSSGQSNPIQPENAEEELLSAQDFISNSNPNVWMLRVWKLRIDIKNLNLIYLLLYK